MKKHIFSLITLSAASIGLLTSCSNSTDQSQTVADSTTVETKQQESASQKRKVKQTKAAEQLPADAKSNKVTDVRGMRSKHAVKKRSVSEIAPTSAQAEVASPQQLMAPSLSSAMHNQESQLDEVERMPDVTLEPRHSLRSQQIFKKYGVNPTQETRSSPISTFSMDVDNGSYKLAADMLNKGRLPNVDGIRIEEFINAFDYDYTPSNDVFGISAQVFPSPNREGYHVMHLGIQTQQLKDHERNPSNLVLVADTSGSMQGGNLALLKEAFTTLVSQLNAQDSVSIITYSTKANVVLTATKAADKNKIYAVINNLTASGSTNAASGIDLAYQQAERMYKPGFNNRVILTSDGMANMGRTSPEGILKTITTSKDKGIFLTTVGVGQGNINDHLLEQLANQGNGQYLYLGNTKDIQHNFVDGLTQSLQTVAKDAKIQVTFNGHAVESYRLLGYENRALKTEDFTDPNVDGGEVGAGHSVTALYEVKLINPSEKLDLAEIEVAYKKPMGNKVNTMKKLIPAKVIVNSIKEASPASTLSLAVASFSEKLRQTYWARNYQYEDISALLNDLPLQYRQQNQVSTLQQLITRAKAIDDRNDDFEVKYPIAKMNFDRVPLLD